MAETDAEHRHIGGRELPYFLDHTASSRPGRPGRWIRKMPSGLRAKTSSAGVSAGTTVTRQPNPSELAKGIRLDAEVVADDVILVAVGRRIIESLSGCDRARQLAVVHRWRRQHLCQKAFGVEIDGRDAGPHRTFVANMADEGTRVDVLEADDVAAFEI